MEYRKPSLKTFQKRHGSYKAGSIVLVIGLIAHCVGFGTSFWTNTTFHYFGTLNATALGSQNSIDFRNSTDPATKNETNSWRNMTGPHLHLYTYNGLWENIVDMFYIDFAGHVHFVNSTGDDGSSSYPAWFKAVQGLQCLSLAGAVVSVFFIIVYNCTPLQLPSLRLVEILAGFSSLTGFISLALYGGYQTHAMQVYLAEKYDFERRLHVRIEFQPISTSYMWDVLGLLLIFMGFLFIAIFNKKPGFDSDVDISVNYKKDDTGRAGYYHDHAWDFGEGIDNPCYTIQTGDFPA